MAIDFSVLINEVSLESGLIGDLSKVPDFFFETCWMYVGWTITIEKQIVNFMQYQIIFSICLLMMYLYYL